MIKLSPKTSKLQSCVTNLTVYVYCGDAMRRMIVYYRGERDKVKVKTLIHGPEFQIPMGRENEFFILSQKALEPILPGRRWEKRRPPVFPPPSQRRISCHGRNYSQPYFLKRNQSSDNRSHGFGAKCLLKKLSASDSSYERKSALKRLKVSS